MTMGGKNHLIGASAPTCTVLCSWAGYFHLSFQNLFLHYITQIGAPTIKHHHESCCYYILLGLSKKQIWGSESDSSRGNDGFSWNSWLQITNTLFKLT